MTYPINQTSRRRSTTGVNKLIAAWVGIDQAGHENFSKTIMVWEDETLISVIANCKYDHPD
jgi:hypothetical protein